MASQDRRFSLIASLDDFYHTLTTDNERLRTEFLAFVRNQEECRKRWLATEVELERLKRFHEQSTADLQVTLKRVRRALDKEITMRKKVEEERDSLERQIALIRNLLSDPGAIDDETRERFAFISNGITRAQNDSPGRLGTVNESNESILSPTDYSYDKTDEDLEFLHPRAYYNRRSSSRKSGEKRPSAPYAEDIVGKRKKSNTMLELVTNEPLIATTTVTVPTDGPVMATSRITTRSMSKVNRSNSDPTPETTPVQTSNRHLAPAPQSAEESSYWQTPSAHATPQTIRRNLTARDSASRLNSRVHYFCTKTIIKPENCTPCGKKIRFGKPALKCRDCRATCHPECKIQVPLPCVPTVSTPTAAKGIMGSIADYTPQTNPMVPALIVHCINEIESRGTTEVGIYRIPGSERDVNDLRDRFLRAKVLPNLSKVELHVICGCLKNFLRGLKEPLITYLLWKQFVDAAEIQDRHMRESQFYHIIPQLPQPNRDTLAYVILHLQRVSQMTETKMSASNLAKIFGPTVVGYSGPDVGAVEMFSETKKQALVIERLMAITEEYWNRFVNVGADGNDESGAARPEARVNHLGRTSVASLARAGPSNNQAAAPRTSSQTPVALRLDRRKSWKAPKPDKYFSPLIK